MPTYRAKTNISYGVNGERLKFKDGDILPEMAAVIVEQLLKGKSIEVVQPSTLAELVPQAAVPPHASEVARLPSGADKAATAATKGKEIKKPKTPSKSTAGKEKDAKKAGAASKTVVTEDKGSTAT